MAKPIQREHIAQKHCKLFVRDVVEAEHEFFAFDRGKATGALTHLRERSRGIRRGTPDTLLRVAGFPPIWCEWKAPGKTPDDAQEDMGERLQRLGDVWFWTTTITEYWQALVRAGVPLRANAALLAAHHDASVAGVILTAERKRGDAPKPAGKPRPVKASAGQIKRMSAVRGRVQF